MGPEVLALARVTERVYIANHDERITRTRQEHIQALRGKHKADVAGRIASNQGGNDDVALFALIVIYRVDQVTVKPRI